MENFAVVKHLHTNLVGNLRISYFPLCVILGFKFAVEPNYYRQQFSIAVVLM